MGHQFVSDTFLNYTFVNQDNNTIHVLTNLGSSIIIKAEYTI